MTHARLPRTLAQDLRSSGLSHCAVELVHLFPHCKKWAFLWLWEIVFHVLTCVSMPRSASLSSFLVLVLSRCSEELLAEIAVLVQSLADSLGIQAYSLFPILVKGLLLSKHDFSH